MEDKERINRIEMELDAYVAKMSIKELLTYYKTLISKKQGIMNRLHDLFKGN